MEHQKFGIRNPESENGNGTGTGIRERKIEDFLTVLLTIIDFTRLFISVCYIYFIVAFSSFSASTLIYTSELILCSTICVHSATRHKIIYMYPYFLFAAIHHLNRPRLSLSDHVA